MNPDIKANAQSPPAFAWEAWYDGVGGRTIDIAEGDEILRQIYEEQYPRFDGPVAQEKHVFASPEAAAEAVKAKARAFGADIVGICEIEPSDLYRGRHVEENYAVAVGQRMRWRAFQTVPSREAAIECLRIYHSLGETVIALAAYLRSLGYSCQIEHPLGDSDLLHIPKEWARDFDGFKTKLFPDVVMASAPPPVDPVPEAARHAYPTLKR